MRLGRMVVEVVKMSLEMGVVAMVGGLRRGRAR